MKIFHITSYKEKCGIADYAEHLMTALAKFGVESIPAPIRRSEHKYMTSKDVSAFYDELAESIPERSIVHLQHEFGFFGCHGYEKSIEIFGRLLARLARKKVRVVVTFHSIPPDFIRLNLKNRMSQRKLARLSAKWHTKIVPVFKSGGCIAVCHNKYTQLALIKRRIPREATRVLYFPCAENGEVSVNGRSIASSPDAKASLGIDADRLVLTCFGFISRYKGIHTIVRALQFLPDKYLFLLAGDKHPESDENSLETMLKESKREHWMESAAGRKRRIIVTGYVEKDRIPVIWDATDIVLSCYEHVPSYSMSAALPVALASGKPIIASQIPAFKEVNEMGDCLATVLPGAPHELALAIQRLAGSDSEKARLVRNAQDYSRNHTWEKFAEQTTRIYRDLATPAVSSISA